MDSNDNLEFNGKVKGMMTFKEHHQARLLKDKVYPASELARRKQEEIERAEAFTRSAEDESFYNLTESSVDPRDPGNIGKRLGIITREPFGEQP